MSVEKMSQQMTALETTVAYQEKTIEDLSDVVYEQEQRLGRLEATLRVVVQQLAELGIPVDPTRERPPHY